ncbi:putative multifunctional protein ADE2 [Aphelenchoides besseyi]|nr:putative multifunctional protein ADE2 [Aphelenchoides besseyi]KAI6236227.1 putative multifunctional protein ADE2 [Aphelenchoides besseyi]
MADPLAQGKTKAIFAIDGKPDRVRVKSLDSLTAFNAKRKNEIEGKAEIASKTTCNVFRFLNECGLKTHFVQELSASEFEAYRCAMIPIEWVARRVATGSFLKRNPGVAEGYTFTPPLIETFFKDDENDDPQWSEAQILSAGFEFNGRKIGIHEYRWMSRATSVIFRLLERAWRRQGCVLVDMKIEFGVTTNGDVVLADVIDNDSWRVWPNGDRRLQLDKQFYRDLPQVTDEAIKELKKNYDRVEQLTREFVEDATKPRAVIPMGSGADMPLAEKIATHLRSFGVRPILRVYSAHKSTAEVLDMVAEYESDSTPTVFIAIAGRSNGLGPVISANTVLPVINAPPVNAEWTAHDIWSSLRMPSGVGCTTAMGPDEVALAAAKIFANGCHLVYGRLLVSQLNNVGKILDSDREAFNRNE